MITVIGGIKGGSGKTTIATNLAVMRAATKKVLLVDADEQKSACDWAQEREFYSISLINGSFSTICMSGKAMHSNLVRLHKDYDDIIVDTGGRDTTSQRAALCVADCLVLPLKPSSIDIWTMLPVMGIVTECVNINLKILAVINQADSAGKDNEQAKEILKEFERILVVDRPIVNRKAFRNAASEGLGVIEMVPRDKKACEEMEFLYDCIYI